MENSLSTHQEMQQEMTIGRWLFNPFVRIAGARSLTIGLAGIVVAGLAAAGAGIHFDGLLDVHAGNEVALWMPVVEGLMNWAVFTLLLVVVALLFSKSAVRLIDIAGTQAMARMPLLLVAVICNLPWIRGAFDRLAGVLLGGELDGDALTGLAAGILVMLAGVIWMVNLMWKAFSISCNMKGCRAVALFILAVLLGEAATVYLAGNAL
jgi:hypothetical protein